MTLAIRWFAVAATECDRRCVVCGRPLAVLSRGDCVAGLVSGGELISVVGDECLTDAARAELSRLRRLADESWRTFLSAPRSTR
jgi:hypothetical protein